MIKKIIILDNLIELFLLLKCFFFFEEATSIELLLL